MNTDYLNLLDRHIVTKNKTHKHKRAERQYDDYYTAYDDEDIEFCNDNYYELSLLLDDELLCELDLEHYTTDFNWEAELNYLNEIKEKDDEWN